MKLLSAAEAIAKVKENGKTLTVPKDKRTVGKGSADSAAPTDDGGFMRSLGSALKHLAASPQYCRTLIDNVMLLPPEEEVRKPGAAAATAAAGTAGTSATAKAAKAAGRVPICLCVFSV